MNEENNMPTWMFASGTTYSYEILEKEPEVILEFDCDRYGNEFILKENIFIGFRGIVGMDAGYIYAPYIPAIETPEIIMGVDPVGEFNPNVQIAKRYAEKEINKNFYGEIKIDEII